MSSNLPLESRTAYSLVPLERWIVVRFDLVQQEDDPTRFLLVEIYRTPADPARHKETAHYATWRDAVEPMMAEPRRGVKYRSLFPEPDAWERPR